ncbi:capping protein-inhibiting regulator of actin dynamics isoform X2 [Cavia porcellus]|uniref:capping protein-inhibiting regulator of actin dynamics isoform X2 n=1 Tax=Cavia porcellus TaxID=10141 RepID=UPI002FDF29BC
MATEEIKLAKNVHSEAVSAHVSDKKKGGKFQPFKKLFGKRKKKDPSLSREESVGKKSYSPQCVSNGTFSSDEETLGDNLRSFNYSMGTRALSHDSIFIPDGGAESEQTVQAMSQDNILGKVKTLQRHLGKNIKFGQKPPNAIPMKKAGSGDASSEEDLFLTSPMEIVTQQDIVLSDTENKAAPVKPSRPKRHLSSAGTIESVNLDAIPLAIARLDNSAAKHKLSVKPKNQRVSKKHRRLARDRPSEPGLEPSLDQNGHPGEDKHIWHEEEPQPLGAQEEKRRQEDYWRELEAKCKQQKAEAAEKRRLEEQRLQALERRLWEENRRQELLEEEGKEEEGEGEPLLLEAEKASWEEGQRSGLEEQGCHEQEQRERREAKEQKNLREEAERQQEEKRELEEFRKLEAQQLAEEEAQRLQEEAQRLQEEAQRLQEEEARRLQEEAQRLQEEEARRLQEEEAQRLQEEAQRLQEEEARRLQEEEAQRREEEAWKREEAQRQEELKQREELEAKSRQEQEEEERLEELSRQQQEAPRREELEQGKEREAQRWPGAEKSEPWAAPPLWKEETQSQVEDSRDRPQNYSVKPEEEQENMAPNGRRESSEDLPDHEVRPAGEQPGTRGGCCGEERRVLEDKRESAYGDPPQEREAPVEEKLKSESAIPEKDRKAEEMRWQEVEERQTMPRPYTFQVSSGGRQILFPKVNLSPVTPAQEPKVPRALSVPHTAILVTGAQLCSPAVNLHQIKDTACMSLLGLSEEKRPGDVPATAEPRAGGKARPLQEPPGSSAALAEWASIRSRILKNVEGEPRGGDKEQSRPGDEPAPRPRSDSRGHLRRTPPANAKFSIMPAWQKFSDTGTEISRQSLEADSIRKRPSPGLGEETAPRPPPQEFLRTPEKPEVRPEPTDATEGCKFAKDLPSFLVPSLPPPPLKAVSHAEPTTSLDGESASGTAKPDLVTSGGEEKSTPFGIKLRRTNYSLRFHCDQQAEQKKKKRHSSTGDSVDSPSERETEGRAAKPSPALPQDRKQAPAPRRDSAGTHPSGAHPSPPPASSQAPAAEQDKAASRTTPVQKPALAPKPAGHAPPPSPLTKLSRPYLVELLARRAGKPDSEPSPPPKESQESRDPQPPSPPPPDERKGQKREQEEEALERKPISPPLTATQLERLSHTPEAARKEKPVLQSRHSLDGSKLAEKVETAQPLWITLALQKQKGFREQQATREERKQAREAKQAEKLSKDNASISAQPGSSSVRRTGSLHKSSAQPDEKPETAVSRLERREQLKKANTLPASVTVEISDSAPPAPLVKEVPKRFSTPDAAPVSTEPAWLALAKRKAKAWSDCPQIIK